MQPYSTSSSHFDDDDSRHTKDSVEADSLLDTTSLAYPRSPGLQLHRDTITGEKDPALGGLRQRPLASRKASSEKLFESEMEMVQLDQASNNP